MFSRLNIAGSGGGLAVILLSIFLVGVAAKGGAEKARFDGFISDEGRHRLLGTNNFLDITKDFEGDLQSQIISASGAVAFPKSVRATPSDLGWFFYWDRQSNILWFHSNSTGIIGLSEGGRGQFSELPMTSQTLSLVPAAVVERLPSDTRSNWGF